MFFLWIQVVFPVVHVFFSQKPPSSLRQGDSATTPSSAVKKMCFSCQIASLLLRARANESYMAELPVVVGIAVSAEEAYIPGCARSAGCGTGCPVTFTGCGGKDSGVDGWLGTGVFHE